MPSLQRVLAKVVVRSTSRERFCEAIKGDFRDFGWGLVLQVGDPEPIISTESATAVVWCRFCSRTPSLARWNLRWSATVPSPATAVVVRPSMTTVVPGATALLGTTAAAAWIPATAVTARNALQGLTAGRDPTAGRVPDCGPLRHFSMVASRSSTPLAGSSDCGWISGLGGICGVVSGSPLVSAPICGVVSGFAAAGAVAAVGWRGCCGCVCWFRR